MPAPRPSRLLLLLLPGAAAGCATRSVAAQAPVHWSALPAPRHPGADTTFVRVVASIAPGWHIYSLTQPAGGPVATRITAPPGHGFAIAGALQSGAPRRAFDHNFGIQVELYERTAAFTVPVIRFAAPGSSLASAPGDVRLDVRYQACSDRLCMPPQTAHLDVPLARLGGQ